MRNAIAVYIKASGGDIKVITPLIEAEQWFHDRYKREQVQGIPFELKIDLTNDKDDVPVTIPVDSFITRSR